MLTKPRAPHPSCTSLLQYTDVLLNLLKWCSAPILYVDQVRESRGLSP